nr:pyroglutamyl-peptidase 1 [Onthophagus taurus]
MSERNVVVTGFGPFGIHSINASSEVVKSLPEKIKDVNIIKFEIPVVYEIVDEKIPELWEQYQPILIVHVGVSERAQLITLETNANRTGYIKKDYHGCCHNTGDICDDNSKDCLKTGLCINDICDHLNKSGKVKACISNDAGRYLCEYIFYKSLYVDHTKVLFIHVPMLNQPYSCEQLTEGLIIIIEKALEMLMLNEEKR